MDNRKQTIKEGFKDAYDCKCGGRYKMAGYAHGQYYWDCNKCDKRVIIRWISEEKINKY